MFSVRCHMHWKKNGIRPFEVHSSSVLKVRRIITAGLHLISNPVGLNATQKNISTRRPITNDTTHSSCQFVSIIIIMCSALRILMWRLLIQRRPAVHGGPLVVHRAPSRQTAAGNMLYFLTGSHLGLLQQNSKRILTAGSFRWILFMESPHVLSCVTVSIVE